ncbi:tetratricopeptide repeat protein [bacterium]|nr:tetratricopeptide repeat protein [bacterium]
MKKIFFVLLLISSLPLHAADDSEYKKLTKQFEDLTDKGKFDSALTIALSALDNAIKIFPATDENLAKAYNNVAELERHLGKYPEAEAHYIKALELEKTRPGATKENIAVRYNNLALNYLDIEDTAKAKINLTEAQNLLTGVSTDSEILARVHANLADVARLEGNASEAETQYAQAISVLSKKENDNALFLAQVYNNQGLLFKNLRRFDEATIALNKGIALYIKKEGDKSADVYLSQINLASVYKVQGKYKEAEPIYQKALAGLEKVLGPSHPQIPRVLNNFSGLYFLQGQFGLAEGLVKRALAIAEQNYGLINHPDIMTSLKNLELIYVETGNVPAIDKIHEKMNLVRYGPAEGQTLPPKPTITKDMET